MKTNLSFSNPAEVETECLVAIVLDKGWQQVAAAFGVLRAGAAYLPIDPGLPRERIDYLLRTCDVEVVVTEHSIATCAGRMPVM